MMWRDEPWPETVIFNIVCSVDLVLAYEDLSEACAVLRNITGARL
jgi:hypothetical protein